MVINMNNNLDIERIETALKLIELELIQQYKRYNKHNFNDPFENSGNVYSNSTFTVRAYNWSGNDKPNFEYKDLKVYWYKYLGRGTTFTADSDIDYDYIINMIIECVNSITLDTII